MLTVLLAASLFGARPLIIAHRGASGYLPEHTIEAYDLAIRQGADYIEPDLVATKDGVLIACHENEISGTTDIAAHPELAPLKTKKTIDGKVVEGWFTEDLTLPQIRSLHARERLPSLRAEGAKQDGKLGVPTFEDVLDLLIRKRKETGRSIGIYPETKHPSYFKSIGNPLEPKLLDALKRRGLTDGVFIQSFEVENLRWLKEHSGFPLIQLVSTSGRTPDTNTAYADILSDPALVAKYAAGIGVQKEALWPRERAETFVRKAKAAGLLVHVWTHRKEPTFVMGAFQGDSKKEFEYLLGLGVDGIFSDFPDLAVGWSTGTK